MVSLESVRWGGCSAGDDVVCVTTVWAGRRPVLAAHLAALRASKHRVTAGRQLQRQQRAAGPRRNELARGPVLGARVPQAHLRCNLGSVA